MNWRDAIWFFPQQQLKTYRLQLEGNFDFSYPWSYHLTN
jgi:hypothetical protein